VARFAVDAHRLDEIEAPRGRGTTAGAWALADADKAVVTKCCAWATFGIYVAVVTKCGTRDAFGIYVAVVTKYFTCEFFGIYAVVIGKRMEFEGRVGHDARRSESSRVVRASNRALDATHLPPIFVAGI
jgi:hypothetical protein